MAKVAIRSRKTSTSKGGAKPATKKTAAKKAPAKKAAAAAAPTDATPLMIEDLATLASVGESATAGTIGSTSIRMNQLADFGYVKDDGTEPTGRPGRPPTLWKLTATGRTKAKKGDARKLTKSGAKAKAKPAAKKTAAKAATTKRRVRKA